MTRVPLDGNEMDTGALYELTPNLSMRFCAYTQPIVVWAAARRTRGPPGAVVDHPFHQRSISRSRTAASACWCSTVAMHRLASYSVGTTGMGAAAKS